MSNYWTIANAFVKGDEIKKRWVTKVRNENRAWPIHGPQHAPDGTPRLSVDAFDDCTKLMSYGRLCLGVRKDDGQIIVNADDAGTVTSRKQQREFRSTLSAAKHCLLPFSALSAAGIKPEDVEIIDTTPDRKIVTWRPCRCAKHWHKEAGEYVQIHEDGTHSEKHVAHFLGETLFTRADRPGRYYVSGLDRNDDPRKRHFYLAQLPDGVSPKTVDEALEFLKPEGLPETGWLRQGEWFFVPRPGLKPVIEGENVLLKESKVGWNTTQRGVPITSAGADAAREDAKIGVWGRARRHRATRMFINGSVFVSGMVRDAEHTALKLGDGKTWFQVIRNRAVQSWGAGGQVD
jgi:hypothetical protein